MLTQFFQSLSTNPVWTLSIALLLLGTSIFVHELGHFLIARWRGVKVERFSIGFGPAIWSYRAKDGVEYRLSWVPLGGYVLLPQLADLSTLEGKSESDIATLPPVSYTSKMLVFVAGAAFNVIFAFLLACVLWRIGLPESSASATTRIGYVSAKLELPDGTKITSPALEGGLRVGDVIRAIDGHTVKDWSEVQNSLVLGDGRSATGEPETIFTIVRDGKERDLVLHPRLAGEEKIRRVGMQPGFEILVHSVPSDSLGAQVGFLVDDEILRFDDTAVLSDTTYREYLDATLDRPVVAHVRRAGRELDLTIPVSPTAKAGARLGLTLTTGFRLAHPTPLSLVTDQLSLTFRSLWSFLSPRSDVGLSKASGVVGIVRVFQSAAEAGVRAAILITILVNVNLAIFNLLPIPVLDGGQMLFATIARFRGRALPINFVMTAQSVCLVLLLSLIVYVSFFDIRRWSRDAQENRAAAERAAAASATQPAGGK